MGVKGLWTLLEPAARPVRLEALSHKRLAIDASIWLYQLLKAMKDDEGNPLEDAHILGFYRRICKLLYYGIRPVFVFDGGAPDLKRSTIAERQAMRETKTRDAKRAAHHLLQTQLKLHALGGDPSANSAPPRATGLDGTPSPPKKRKRDEYELPPISQSALATRAENERDLRMAHPDDLQRLLQLASRQSESLGDEVEVDTQSAAFLALSPEDQHDIIVALKVRSRQTSHDRLQHMLQSSESALDFSKQQISLLVKRNNLTQQWLQVTGHTHRTAASANAPSSAVSAGRVAAERNREYMLIKSDQPGGGWTLRLGGDAPVTTQPEPTKPIIVMSSSDAEGYASSEFEDIPPKFSESPTPPSHTPSRLSLARLAVIGNNGTSHGAQACQPYEESAIQVAHTVTSESGGHSVEPSDAMSIAASGSDVEYAEYLSSSSENGYEGSDEEPELMDMYDDYEDQERAMAQHEQRQRDLHLQRQREEQALLEMPADEFLESWMQLVTPVMLHFDPGIFTSMRQWMTVESTLEIERLSCSVNRQLGKQPDINMDNLADDSAVAQAGSAAMELQITRARVMRLTLLSNYLSYVLRWRQYRQDVPSDMSTRQILELPCASAEEQPTPSPVAIILDSESDEPSSSASDLGLTAPVNGSSILVEADSSSDVQEAAQVHRNTIFERSRLLAMQGNPEMPEVRGDVSTNQSRHSDRRNTKHLDSNSESMSDVCSVGDDFTHNESAVNESHGRLVLNNDIHGDDDADGDDDDDDDDYARADLDTTKRQQSELLRSEQSEYALFVNKLRSSADSSIAPAAGLKDGVSFAVVRSELESELQVLRSRVRDTRRDASGVESSMVEDVRVLLSIFGIPYITAPMEAEAQCAALVAAQLVDGMVTDDSDAFLFASSERTQVYRHFFQKDRYVEMYSSGAVFEDSSLTQRDFVFLAFLLGSDYTVGIKGVGPVLAMEALAEFGPSTVEVEPEAACAKGIDSDEARVMQALSGFKDWCDKVAKVLPGIELPAELVSTPRRRRLAQVLRKTELPASFPNARVAHAYFYPQVDDSGARFEWGFPNLDLLRQFLGERLGWSTEKTDETLVPLARKMVDGKVTGDVGARQMTLDEFAMSRTNTHHADLGAANLQRSKRVGTAISLHKGKAKSLQTRRSLI